MYPAPPGCPVEGSVYVLDTQVFRVEGYHQDDEGDTLPVVRFLYNEPTVVGQISPEAKLVHGYVRHNHCDQGGCESCDCCVAGYCVNFEDGDPWVDARDSFKCYQTGVPVAVYRLAKWQFDFWAYLCLSSRGFPATDPGAAP